MTDFVSGQFVDPLDVSTQPVIPAITDDAFAAWLDRSDQLRCILVECVWADPATGATGTECMANLPFVSTPADSPANTAYRAVIKSIPAFSQSMSDFMLGATTANWADVELFAGDEAMDVWLDGTRDFIGRAVTIYLGAPEWPKGQFRKIWSGVMAGVKIKGTTAVTLEVRDWQHLLNQAITRTVFDTPQFRIGANYGTACPLTYGVVHRMKPAAFPIYSSPTTFKWTFFVHDGPVQSIDAVYIHGWPLSSANWVAYPSLGYFEITAASDYSGNLTCDVHGAVDGNGVMYQTPNEILQQIIARSALAALPQDWTGIANKCTQPLALSIGADAYTPAQALDAIVTTVGGYYSVSRDGELYGGRVDFDGDPVIEISADQIVENGLAVLQVLQPRASYSLTWDRYAAAGASWDVFYSANIDGDTRNWLQKGYRIARAENPNAANLAKLEREAVRQTHFVQETDALAEAQRLMAIFGTLRMVVSVDCFLTPARVQLGDRITITHPRYGFAGGRKAIVVGITEQPSRRRIKLKALVQ